MLPPMTTNADKQGPIVDWYNPKGLKHRTDDRALRGKLPNKASFLINGFDRQN